MKERYKMIPIESPDDPERCQGVTAIGQCRMKAYPGSQYCPQHNGTLHEQAQLMPNNERNYVLTKFQAQLDSKLGSPKIKSLREEIAILRMMLEARLNRCNDAYELMMDSGNISDLIARIEKIVVSCHKIEDAMGELLDKNALNTFASSVIGIISTILKDYPKLIGEIADGILALLENPQKETTDK